MGNFQIFMFLESLIKLSCFIDDKNYKVIKRHQYEVGDKRNCSIQTWDERKKNGKKCWFIWHLHNNDKKTFRYLKLSIFSRVQNYWT